MTMFMFSIILFLLVTLRKINIEIFLPYLNLPSRKKCYCLLCVRDVCTRCVNVMCTYVHIVYIHSVCIKWRDTVDCKYELQCYICIKRDKPLLHKR